LSWSTIVLIGVLELEDLALDVDRDLLRQVAARDGRRHLGDVAHLCREVRRHRVDGVGEALPRAGDARHLRLAAEDALRAHLARDARHLGAEGVELVDHRVDRVLELEDLALHVDRDLAREVAARDGGRHFGDVAHLRREVRRHRVDVVGEVLPRAGDAGTCAWPPSLPSVPTSRATRVTSAAKPLSWSTIVLIVFFSSRISPLHVDRDLARQVAARDGGRHLGDVAHLGRQVRRHRVDVVGEVLPRAGDAGHLRLTAELALGADLARDARHLGAKPLSWSTIVLMVFFSSRISPCTSTVILRERSPARRRSSPRRCCAPATSGSTPSR
jgi:hypothetical protein